MHFNSFIYSVHASVKHCFSSLHSSGSSENHPPFSSFHPSLPLSQTTLLSLLLSHSLFIYLPISATHSLSLFLSFPTYLISIGHFFIKFHYQSFLSFCFINFFFFVLLLSTVNTPSSAYQHIPFTTFRKILLGIVQQIMISTYIL